MSLRKRLGETANSWKRHFFSPPRREDSLAKPEDASFDPQESDVVFASPPFGAKAPPRNIDEEIDEGKRPDFRVTQRNPPTKRERRWLRKRQRQARRLNRIARRGR